MINASGAEPWAAGQPLFAFLEQGSIEPEAILPDAEPRDDTQAPLGALIRNLRHRASDWLANGPDPAREAPVAALLIQCLDTLGDAENATANARARVAFYRAASRYIPRLEQGDLDGLLAERGPEAAPIDRKQALWLLRVAHHREAVWAALRILAYVGTDGDLTELSVFMRHRLFQEAALRTASRIVGDPMETWRRLRGRAGFLGNVLLVGQLVEAAPGRADVRAWLVRHGSRDVEAPEVVAVSVADAGELAAALGADLVDDALVAGASHLVETMLASDAAGGGGAADGMSSYEDGVAATEALLRHIERRPDRLARLATAFAIKDWLHAVQELPPEWFGRLEMLGWSGSARRRLIGVCDRIVSLPKWPHMVRATHRGSPDAEQGEVDTRRAWRLAERLRLDLWPETYARLEERPMDPDIYRDLFDTPSERRTGQMLAFAEQRLPIAAMATGLAEGRNHALGEDPEADAPFLCLSHSLTAMERSRLCNRVLLTVALRCPVTRLRLQAARVLNYFSWWQWGELVKDALQQSIAEETDDLVRGALERVAMRRQEDLPSGRDLSGRLGPGGRGVGRRDLLDNNWLRRR